MCPTNTFTAVIAAAGLSTRMGAFKPILPLGEESISRSLVLAFVGAGSIPVTVVTGYMAETLASHLGGLPVRLVHNSAYRTSQMFDSLRLGLLSLQKEEAAPLPDKIFLCPADIPLVSSETIACMARQEADIVIPVCSGRKGHPVCVSSSMLFALLEHDGTDGLRGALNGLSIKPLMLAVSDPGILTDADTMEDYERIKKLLRR